MPMRSTHGPRRFVNAKDGAQRIARQRPVYALVLLALVGVVIYLAAVPSHSWIGWLPRPAYVASVPGWPTAEPGARRALLHDLRTNFTNTWAAKAGWRPPTPLYDAPALTLAQKARYRHLRMPPVIAKRKGRSPTKYMFVAVLKDVQHQLPDMLNTLAIVTSFLGPERISISIVEGPSWDPTGHVLNDVLRPMLLHLGVPDSAINIETGAEAIQWNKANRIEALADLRNRALRPLWEDNGLVPPVGSFPATPAATKFDRRKKRSTVGDDVAAIVYFNDVFLHAADVLELLHQHVTSSRGGLGTGITAAWDWMERHPAYFYDVWVARTMDGDLFYPIDNTWWAPSDAILKSSAVSRSKFDTLSPFQVYSAWNGMAILNPGPFVDNSIAFRRSSASRGECAASECSLLAADFWRTNYGRIQVVPSVQLAYEYRVAYDTAIALREDMKKLGWKDGVPPAAYDKPVVFGRQPPPKVRCNPWPEKPGLGHNVWGKTEWVLPYLS